MFRSLAILKSLPGNEEREQTCETFKNSLLTALRPILRRDVAGVDIAPLKEYLYVFQKLGRSERCLIVIVFPLLFSIPLN